MLSCVFKANHSFDDKMVMFERLTRIEIDGLSDAPFARDQAYKLKYKSNKFTRDW